MAVIRPFAALRPVPGAAARVAAVPYDVVNVEEARTLAEGNALSFLNVSRSEIDLEPDVDPYSDDVYAMAASNFERLKQAAPLVMEDAPSLYLYRLKTDGHDQVGVAAAYSLDEYDRDLIKKHERTRPEKENDRTRHMVALRAQTGPVFLTYRRSAEIDRLQEQVLATSPLFDFEASDGVRHTIWRVPPLTLDDFAAAFARVPTLYIADGHHRAASAARARRSFASGRSGQRGSARGSDTFLAVAFPDNQVRILAYNRTVKDLAGKDPAAFLREVEARVPVTDGTATPSARGEVAMYLPGNWYRLALDTAGADSAISSLDVTRLQEQVLGPVLDIGDPRTDRRIDFVGGARGAGELERMVDAGEAAVAFSMFPVTVDDLMSIADVGQIMPPKSTWFEPKLRDGLLILEI
jgi:uncharacterized protein (DUF1015 family)